MSTVKISQLPALPSIAANTTNTLFLGVDLPTGVTGKFTATTLANQLYSNNSLIVGNSQILLPNTIGQFVSSGNSYVQMNMVNTNDNGTFDIVVTANTGTDSTYFFDAGLANKNYQAGLAFNNIGNAVKPLDGYVYVQGNTGTTSGGNLIVGTTTSNTALKFIVGGGSAANIVAYMSSNSLVLNTQSYITFADGTTQTTAAASNAYSLAAYAQANLANTKAQSGYDFANTINVYSYSAYAFANTINVTQTSINTTQNTWISSNAAFIQAAFNYANTSVQNTATIIINNLSANTVTPTNGIINTVRVNSTSPLTINFTTDAIVRANISANFTVTPASFVAGKTIDVWLTNTSSGGGANHTITHGVSALNSTVGATTFTLAGTQSAWLKYMCADGTLANTFVAITYQ
jgi:hypothetical protein